MKWLAVIGGAGVGLTASVVALVDLVSSQKYVCTDNTADDMVVAAQVIDGLRVFTGLAVTALVAWAYSKRFYMTLTDADRSAIQNNAAGMVVLIIATLTIDNIQRSEACTHCISDDNELLYESVRRMLNGNYICSTQFTQGFFKIPSNYCRTEIEERCPAGDLPSTIFTERCLVYSCSSLVHGYNFRYLWGVAGLVAQLLVCMVFMLSNVPWEKEVPVANVANMSEDPKHQGANVEYMPSAPPASLEHQGATDTPLNRFKPFPSARRRNAFAYSKVSQLDF